MIVEISSQRQNHFNNLRLANKALKFDGEKILINEKKGQLSNHKKQHNSHLDLTNRLMPTLASSTSQLVMHKLGKQSQKTFRFTTGKNKQEEKRLQLTNGLLEKNYTFEDNNWLKDFIDVKKNLNDIQTSSQKYGSSSSMSTISSKSRTRSRVSTSTTFNPKEENNPHSYCSVNRSSKLSNYTFCSGHSSDSNSNTKCTLFPCKFIKSYKSIVGSQNDRTEDQIESYWAKRFILDKSSRPATSATLKTETTLTYYDLTDEEDENSNSENLNTNKFLDALIEYKSIRRPLRRYGSGKDIVNKMKSLENKVNFCREQNHINFSSDDRNVRYGDPAPKNKKFKQLKILSQLETIVK